VGTAAGEAQLQGRHTHSGFGPSTPAAASSSLIGSVPVRFRMYCDPIAASLLSKPRASRGLGLCVVPALRVIRTGQVASTALELQPLSSSSDTDEMAATMA
jgi:hypothetical protein